MWRSRARCSRDDPSVEVDTFDGLLVDYARRRAASVIVRGLRAVSDFESEMQMALMNRHLSPDLETVFMMPAEAYTYVSSRLVKEVFALGGSVGAFVPPAVERRMWEKRRPCRTIDPPGVKPWAGWPGGRVLAGASSTNRRHQPLHRIAQGNDHACSPDVPRLPLRPR